MKKTFTAIFTAMVFCALFGLTSVSASVIGNDTTDGWYRQIEKNTFLHQNVYYSDSVGYQTEYIVEYTPTEDIVPTVVTGSSIYGKRTIVQAAEWMEDNGMYPLIGINGDYFSFKTGIPMGHSVVNGEIIAKEDGYQPAVGFYSDGTGYIGELSIKSSVTANSQTVELANINKWWQSGIPCLYFLTSDYGSETHTSGDCRMLILSKTGGSLSLGGTLKLVVEDVFDYDSSAAIPEGKYMLLADMESLGEEYVSFINGLSVGTEVEINSYAEGDSEKWASADYVMSCQSGYLVKNGEVQSGFESGANPRTAVGIKENGDILFYVIDGRQTGYSYGLQMKTLAERMAELGCVEAISLDGGGSTSMAGYYWGESSISVINSPSEGTLRSVANFIFLQKKENKQYYIPEEAAAPTPEPTPEPVISTPVPDNGRDINVSIVFSDNRFDISINAHGETLDIDNVGLYIDNTEQDMSQIGYTQTASDIIEISFPTTVDFAWEYHKVKVIVSTESRSQIGIYTQKAGAVNYTFSDTEDYWNGGEIEYLADRGILSGSEENGVMVYKPDDSMTRAEFAKLAVNFAGADLSEFSQNELTFDDADEIPAWAEDYVKAALALDIVTGKSDGDRILFAPNDTLSRAEAVTILARLLPDGLPESELAYSDAGDIEAWSKNAFSVMTALGIVNGYEDNTIKPNNPVTRAQAAHMLFNLY